MVSMLGLRKTVGPNEPPSLKSVSPWPANDIDSWLIPSVTKDHVVLISYESFTSILR